MIGIYFINDRVSLHELSKEESFHLQKQTILQYFQEHSIHVPKLNPYQLHDYYTNPHALLYDLKKEHGLVDYFLIYSMDVMEDFIYSYPAKWLILKSYFKDVISIREIQVKKIG